MPISLKAVDVPLSVKYGLRCTARRNLILDMEIEHNGSHNSIYSTGGEGKPC